MGQLNPTTRMGFAALLSGAGILGFAAIFVRWSAGVSPVAVGFYRMLFALPAIAWLALREGWPHADERRGVFWAMLGGLCFSADLWLWHTAIHFTSAANATLLVGLAPLWVSLISVIFLGHRLEARGWVGLALALGGASLLAVGAGARLGGGRGELLGFLASFGYAGYMLSLSRARSTLSARRALLVVVATCCVFFAVMGSAQGVAFRGFPASSWLALLALGLPIQVGAWWLISWGFGHVNASLGSLGLLFQQAATVLLGALLLHEIPTFTQTLGILLILGGIALGTTVFKRVRRKTNLQIEG